MFFAQMHLAKYSTRHTLLRDTHISISGTPFITGSAVTGGLFKSHPAFPVGIDQQIPVGKQRHPVLRHCPGTHILHVPHVLQPAAASYVRGLWNSASDETLGHKDQVARVM
jgi:hypothetical protein